MYWWFLFVVYQNHQFLFAVQFFVFDWRLVVHVHHVLLCNWVDTLIGINSWYCIRFEVVYAANICTENADNCYGPGTKTRSLHGIQIRWMHFCCLHAGIDICFIWFHWSSFKPIIISSVADAFGNILLPHVPESFSPLRTLTTLNSLSNTIFILLKWYNIRILNYFLKF